MTHYTNFTEGPLKKRIILFALPIAVSSIIQQLFNSADSAIVGKFAGSNSMASVGTNAPIINMFIALFIGLSIGTNVIISKLKGKNSSQNILQAIYEIIFIAIISGIILFSICFIFSENMLLLVKTPSNIFYSANLYLKVYAFGMPALLIYNFISAILRGIGDSKSPTIAIFISGFFNVILNLLFVCVFKADVIGVAIATDISNILSAITVLFYLKKHFPKVRILNIKHIKKIYIKDILISGIPAGVQGIIFALSNMLIQTSINSFGEKAIAGSSIAFTFECIGYYIINSFNQASITFTSQNYSINKINRCKQILIICVTLASLSCLLINSFVWAFKDYILLIFTSDKEVIYFASVRISIVLLFQWIATGYEVGGATLRGMNHSYIPSIITIAGTCILRFVWIILLFPNNMTYSKLMYVYPITWLITSALLFLTLLITMKRRNGIFDNE